MHDRFVLGPVARLCHPQAEFVSGAEVGTVRRRLAIAFGKPLLKRSTTKAISTGTEIVIQTCVHDFACQNLLFGFLNRLDPYEIDKAIRGWVAHVVKPKVHNNPQSRSARMTAYVP